VIYYAAVDAGINGSGLALFDRSELARAAYVKNPTDKKASPLARQVGMGRALYEVLTAWLGSHPLASLAVEYPRALLPDHQSEEKRKVDINDLFGLVGVGAALGALLRLEAPQYRVVYPDEWKQQLPKFVANERVWDHLALAEKARVERRNTKSPGGPIGLDHNTLDA
jgi:hypothetical protein